MELHQVREYETVEACCFYDIHRLEGGGGFLNGFHRRGDTTPLKFPASDGCRLHGYTGGKLLQRYTRYRITNNVEYL